jgi:hypothetical protein
MRWRVRTRFRELRIAVRPPAPGPTTHAPLLSDLWFELENGNRRVARAVTEIHDALRGLRTPRSLDDTELDHVRWDFEAALHSRELVIEEVRQPPHVPNLEPPPDPPAPPPDPGPPTQTTFIEVEVRDPDGKPVSCRVRIELPNGEVREAHTGSDGTTRIDGIEQGGSAKITFPDLDGEAATQH